MSEKQELKQDKPLVSWDDYQRKTRWRWTDQYRKAKALQKELNGPTFPREYYEYLAKVQRILSEMNNAGMRIDNHPYEWRLWGDWDKGMFRMFHPEWKMTQKQAREYMRRNLDWLRCDFVGWLNLNVENRPLFIGSRVRLSEDRPANDCDQSGLGDDVIYQRWLAGMTLPTSQFEPWTGDGWQCTVCRNLVHDKEKHDDAACLEAAEERQKRWAKMKEVIDSDEESKDVPPLEPLTDRKKEILAGACVEAADLPLLEKMRPKEYTPEEQLRVNKALEHEQEARQKELRDGDKARAILNEIWKRERELKLVAAYLE